MIDLLGTLMNFIVEFWKHDITIDGWTFSLWQVLLFTIVASILCFIVGEFMDIGD